jgi:hypothetical protein
MGLSTRQKDVHVRIQRTASAGSTVLRCGMQEQQLAHSTVCIHGAKHSPSVSTAVEALSCAVSRRGSVMCCVRVCREWSIESHARRHTHLCLGTSRAETALLTKRALVVVPSRTTSRTRSETEFGWVGLSASKELKSHTHRGCTHSRQSSNRQSTRLFRRVSRRPYS